MIYFNSFIFAGLVCAIAQFILSKTKLTPGHVTVIFVCLGAFLDIFNIYDKLILWAGGGALVPITSFGHMLTHGEIAGYETEGFMGILGGTFNLTAIVVSFFLALIFKPKD